MTMPSGRFAFLVLCSFALAALARGQEAPRSTLANGGMEEGEPGKPPSGWLFRTNVDASAAIDTENPFVGARSVSIDASKASGSKQPFTNLMQSLDAKDWQGKRVRFRGAVRVGELPPGASVQLWLRIDRPDKQLGAFDNMGDRPITTTSWSQQEIVLDVAADAERVVCGMFVLGRGTAWLDDVALETVGADVGTTGGGALASMPTALSKAFADAANAPQQPFFTAWLILPALAIFAFLIALWPTSGRSAPGVEPARPPGALRRFAMQFTIAYWLVYCLPIPFSELIPWLGSYLRVARGWFDHTLVAWTARAVFGIEGALVPPNGSGDTTFNYILALDGFVLAAILAVAWWIVAGRRFTGVVTLDLLRSYLRYVLAFAMLGYGLAKVTMEQNQFPVVGDWQLSKTWGECSPMNVVWAFMGSSRPYTIFAGLGEVLAALLLVWRRTGSLGALVAIGVLTNVVMMNFCYDVPVKLYSSHLLLMAILIVTPDVARLASVLVLNRATSPNATNPWSGNRLRWVRVGIKAIVIVVGFAIPVGRQAAESYAYVSALRAESTAPTGTEEPLLLRRGFRWINEVPFNR